jgi:hypothetical protein
VPAETPSRSTPAAASRATAGRLVVQSTPSNAGVTINDTWRGRTPLTVDPLKFGTYTVRVVAPGFSVAREQFTLSQSSPTQALSFRLKPAPGSRAGSAGRGAPAPPPAASEGGLGSVYVDSRPRGAQVFVDDRPVGTTPLRISDVKTGPHTIRLELAGHRVWSVSRQVTAGQETRVAGSLDPMQ